MRSGSLASWKLASTTVHMATDAARRLVVCNSAPPALGKQPLAIPTEASASFLILTYLKLLTQNCSNPPREIPMLSTESRANSNLARMRVRAQDKKLFESVGKFETDRCAG